MREPLVSVIVPVWNGAASLAACLRSIQAQGLQDMEIIVVDDGSTDESWTVLSAMAQEDPRIRPIRQKNAGVSRARNAALEVCRGQYIRFVDADDRLTEGSLQALLTRAREDGCDLVLGAYDEVLLERHFRRDLGRCEDTVDNDEFLRRLERLSNSFYYGVLWNKLFRGDLIREKGLRFVPDMPWGEDFCFVMDYCAHAERVGYTTACVYEYHRNPKGAVMRQFWRCFIHPVESIKDRFRVYEHYVGLYRSRGRYEEYRGRLWLYLLRFTINN